MSCSVCPEVAQTMREINKIIFFILEPEWTRQVSGDLLEVPHWQKKQQMCRQNGGNQCEGKIINSFKSYFIPSELSSLGGKPNILFYLFQTLSLPPVWIVKLNSGSFYYYMPEAMEIWSCLVSVGVNYLVHVPGPCDRLCRILWFWSASTLLSIFRAEWERYWEDTLSCERDVYYPS